MRRKIEINKVEKTMNVERDLRVKSQAGRAPWAPWFRWAQKLPLAVLIACLFFASSCADSSSILFQNSKKTQSETLGQSDDDLNSNVSVAPGTILFSYDPESNSMSALICDTKLNLLLSNKVKPALAGVRGLMHRRQNASNKTKSTFNEPCETVWGLSFESILALKASGTAAQSEKLNAVWNAARTLAVAQVPSTGLMLAAMALAWVTASSSFHEISAQIEGFQFQEAVKTFQNIDPEQVGWTGASLFLFATSRVASAATMSKRVGTVLEVRQTLALAQFGEAFSSAFDKVTAAYTEPELEKILDAAVAEGPMLDRFMIHFVDTLNAEVLSRKVAPKTVLVALQTLSVSDLVNPTVIAQSHRL